MKPHERIILDFDASNLDSAPIYSLRDYVGLIRVSSLMQHLEMARLFRCRTQNALGSWLGKILALEKVIHPRKVFLDLRLNLDPGGMSEVVKALSRLNVEIISVHTLRLESVASAVASKGATMVFGDILCEGMDEEACMERFQSSRETQTFYSAELLLKANANGIVCALDEARFLRGLRRFDPLLVACQIGPEDDLREAVGIGIDYVVLDGKAYGTIGSLQERAKEVRLGLIDKERAYHVP